MYKELKRVIPTAAALVVPFLESSLLVQISQVLSAAELVFSMAVTIIYSCTFSFSFPLSLVIVG